MALKNTHDLPPFGFQVRVPEINWSSTPYIGLEATVIEVERKRVANPRFGWPTDRNSIRVWVLGSVEARLRAMPGGAGVGWLVPDSPPPVGFSQPSRQRQPGLAQHGPAAAGAAKAVAGIGLLADFLGPTLRAVPHELAEKRGGVCVFCPQNKKGGVLAHALGEGLKLLLAARSDLKLFTSHDIALYECAACECNLHLKPHVELAYILEKTTPEQMAKLDARCWILKEDMSD